MLGGRLLALISAGSALTGSSTTMLSEPTHGVGPLRSQIASIDMAHSVSSRTGDLMMLLMLGRRPRFGWVIGGSLANRLPTGVGLAREWGAAPLVAA